MVQKKIFATLISIAFFATMLLAIPNVKASTLNFYDPMNSLYYWDTITGSASIGNGVMYTTTNTEMQCRYWTNNFNTPSYAAASMITQYTDGTNIWDCAKLIAKKHSWQWIATDPSTGFSWPIDETIEVTGMIMTTGLVELAIKHYSGWLTRESHFYSIGSTLSPFQWHKIAILVQYYGASLYIDDQFYISTGGPDSILQGTDSGASWVGPHYMGMASYGSTAGFDDAFLIY